MIAPLAALLRYHEIQTDGIAPRKRAEVNRLLQSMSTDLLEKYEKVRHRHGKNALAELDRGVCMGCYVRQARTPEVDDDIHECEQCGRLLYDPNVAFEYSVG